MNIYITIRITMEQFSYNALYHTEYPISVLFHIDFDCISYHITKRILLTYFYLTNVNRM